MSNRRNLTQIPWPDLEYFSSHDVINLLRAVAAERDELHIALQNEQAKSAAMVPTAYPAANNNNNNNVNTMNNNTDAYGFPYPDPGHDHNNPPPLGGHNHHQQTHATNLHNNNNSANQHQQHHNHNNPPYNTMNTNNSMIVANNITFNTTANVRPHQRRLPNNNDINNDDNDNSDSDYHTDNLHVDQHHRQHHNNNNNNNHAIPSTFKVDAVKKRIAKKSFTLVKKTAHNQAKKPYTELNEAVPTTAAAMALFDGYEPKSDTSRLIKWELTGDQVVHWLGGQNKYIHPVKFDGRVIAIGVVTSKPLVYAWAKYDSLQAKFDKKSGSLCLKFRTKMVGSGRPAEGADVPPSFGVV